ncbi:MAG: hypothetical protein ACR2QC_12185 [Gammaproteobacteria bacterium]
MYKKENKWEALTGGMKLDCYCVNKKRQEGGEHEVHNLSGNPSCLPNGENRKSLGPHPNCHSALDEARNHYGHVDGCRHCCKECHSR